MPGKELLEEAARALKLPHREQFVRLKALGYQAIQEFQKTPLPEINDLLLYMELLRMVRKIPSPPRSYNSWMLKMTRAYLKLTGAEHFSLLYKKSSRIAIESGTICVGDRAFAVDLDKFGNAEKDYLDLMNKGQFFFFGTGGDWMFNFQLRVIEAQEPVLSEKEYKCVQDASLPVVLHFPTGRLVVDDGLVSPFSPAGLEVEIPPGNYKCQAYNFAFKGNFSFYIVLAKTDKEAVNEVHEIESLS